MKYTGKFYSQREGKTRYAASRILSQVIKEHFDEIPQTVVDVGCGTGVWLSVAENLGVSETLGIEGTWLPVEEFIASGKLDKCNFTESLSNYQKQKKDLCLSMEVAEHLPESYAEEFVKNLVEFSDVVLFSAAVVGQGGRHHVNEQPLSYWADLFSHFGYYALDSIRPEIWGDKNIPFWYRQNTVIFTQNKRLIKKYNLDNQSKILDAIHPELFENYRYPRVYIATKQILSFPMSVMRTIRNKLCL